MASRVQLLSDQTINQIAAGEVIENPASVVKELLDNAIDAGATEITVEILGGGRQLIRLSDNGCGMGKDDALLSFERHATSKIHCVEDLFTLETMGFRGEALPSIASISQLTLLTRKKEEKEGTFISIQGGKMVDCSPAERDGGTTIEVKQLFYNVPARKQFQRSPTQDAQAIQKLVSHFSLVFPHIHFRLIHQQKTLFHAPPLPPSSFLDQLRSRLKLLQGKELLDAASHMDWEQKGISLKGVLAAPTFHKPNRTGQLLFINQRLVSCPLVALAILEGYGTRLPERRHPCYTLFLQLPPEDLDVNVHPQKKEVRIKRGQHLKEVLTHAIDQALTPASSPLFATPSCTPTSFASSLPPSPRPFSSPSLEKSSPSPPPNQELSWSQQAERVLDEEDRQERRQWQEITPPSPSFVPPPLSDTPRQLEMEPSPQLEQPPRVLATLPDYILLQKEGEKNALFLLNQRHAHSRILFEKMVEREPTHPQLEFQQLLLPLSLQLSAAQQEWVLSHEAQFAQMGVRLKREETGEIAVHAIASFLKNPDLQALIEDAFDQEQALLPSSQEPPLKRLALAASRAALKTGTQLDLLEAQSLVRQLFLCHSPFQSPFGKATLVHLSPSSIEQLFLTPCQGAPHASLLL